MCVFYVVFCIELLYAARGVAGGCGCRKVTYEKPLMMMTTYLFIYLVSVTFLEATEVS